MNKISLFFILLLVCSINSEIYSQKKSRISVIEKNGQKTTGWGSLSSSGKILMIPDSLGIQKLYFLSNLDYARVSGIKYKQLPVKGKSKMEIVQSKIDGELSLFYKVKTGVYTFNSPSGFSSAPYNYNNIYVIKEGETRMTHLGSEKLISKNFKKGAIEYFKDCTELVKKIEEKEFRKKDIMGIVYFYNEHCSE